MHVALLFIAQASASTSPATAETHLQFLSALPPVPCREDLATFAELFFARTGNAAEVGVYQGAFAEHNLHHWKGDYFAVDAWAYRPGDPPDKNYAEGQINDHNYNVTYERTRRWHNRVHLVRNVSVMAASKFPDGFFDWIYVDALHSYTAVMADLHAWWPKLRAGGLISGDDYGDRNQPQRVVKHRAELQAKPHQVESSRLAAHSQYWTIPHTFDWGVVRATNDFARETGAILHVGWLTGSGLLEDASATCYTWPAWYMVKPFADEIAAADAAHNNDTTLIPPRGGQDAALAPTGVPARSFMDNS